MEENAKYEIIRNISFDGTDATFRTGMMLYRTHGCYYVDGMLMPKFYQVKFGELVKNEENNGFDYLNKIY